MRYHAQVTFLKPNDLLALKTSHRHSLLNPGPTYQIHAQCLPYPSDSVDEQLSREHYRSFLHLELSLSRAMIESCWFALVVGCLLAAVAGCLLGGEGWHCFEVETDHSLHQRLC